MNTTSFSAALTNGIRKAQIHLEKLEAIRLSKDIQIDEAELRQRNGEIENNESTGVSRRGRPKKSAYYGPKNKDEVSDGEDEMEQEPPVKRGKGRPKNDESERKERLTEIEQPKRERGRPPKYGPHLEKKPTTTDGEPPKRRGRPPKNHPHLEEKQTASEEEPPMKKVRLSGNAEIAPDFDHALEEIKEIPANNNTMEQPETSENARIRMETMEDIEAEPEQQKVSQEQAAKKPGAQEPVVKIEETEQPREQAHGQSEQPVMYLPDGAGLNWKIWTKAQVLNWLRKFAAPEIVSAVADVGINGSDLEKALRLGIFTFGSKEARKLIIDQCFLVEEAYDAQNQRSN